MNNYGYEASEVREMTGAARHILTGVVVGGLIGATAMLLLAPRSGEETRAEIRDRALDLRDRTAGTVKDRVSQVVSRAEEIKGNVRGKSHDLKERGQDVLIEQLDRVTEAVDAARRVLQDL